MLGLTGYGSPHHLKQQREADERMHRDKMILLGAFCSCGILKPDRNRTIGDILRVATSLQKKHFRAYLEVKVETSVREWELKYGAPIEPTIKAKIVEHTLATFDKGNYDDGHITRHLSQEIIEQFFGAGGK